jgi:hypothetical protein
MPKLKQALLYDINRGNHSIGVHVRDAACYVVWSFARSFLKDIMRPHVESLATHLCILFLYDREVNCRRAASAAFQECVGRQRTFPHGISILTEADYFTLSNRTNAYLNVSCFIAQYSEYYESLVNHLVNTKMQHWEEEIRQLSGKALSVLSIFNPQLIINTYLPTIYENCFNKALHIRHGALWGLSELILGLSGLSQVSRNKKLEEAMKQIHQKEIEILRGGDENKEFNEMFNELQQKNNMALVSPEMLTKIKSILFDMEEKNLFKGKGGEVMRFSVNHFIKCSSLAKLEFGDDFLEKFQIMIEENAKNANSDVQLSACSAFKRLCLTYHNDDNDVNQNKKYVIDGISKLIERSVKEQNVDSTRGCNMLFGSLSRSVILCMQQKLLKTVISNMVPKGRENDDAETRKYAIRSQIEMLKTLGLASVDPGIIKDTIDHLYKAIHDYAIDKRGDVGSWVREEAMRSLNILMYELFYNYDKDLLKQIVPQSEYLNFILKFIGTILQQLMEKIDKIRQVAGQILQSFLITFCNDLPDFKEKDTLMSIFVFSEE